MTISIKIFNKNLTQEWNSFLDNSLQSSFLFHRSFINYHYDKFTDKSLMIYDDQQLIGLFPAAEDKKNNKNIISHPGITYGGIIQQGRIRGENMIEALKLIICFYSKEKYKKLIYKATPSIYSRNLSEDDLYALKVLGAKLIRSDLSSVINLNNPLELSSRRKRSFNKASKNGIKLSDNLEEISFFWELLKNNLQTKYKTNPVHTINEIKKLLTLFPENIKYYGAILNSKILAGVVIFINQTNYHVQYAASNELGRDNNALDFIFNKIINMAKSEKKIWFDFGISTEKKGNFLNTNLYKFKNEFGAGSILYNFYEINIK